MYDFGPKQAAVTNGQDNEARFMAARAVLSIIPELLPIGIGKHPAIHAPARSPQVAEARHVQCVLVSRDGRDAGMEGVVIGVVDAAFVSVADVDVIIDPAAPARLPAIAEVVTEMDSFDVLELGSN